MADFTEALARHSLLVIFLYVFAKQIGAPLPAVPVLLAMGAFAAAGKLSFALALLVSVVGSVLADSIWYVIGRVRGGDVLRLLCKITLEPDSCVRRTEDLFLRYGVRSLLIAKFVPGLNTVAPPLAGVVGVGVPRFVAYSAVAALLWAGAWGGLGYVAGDALQHVVTASGRLLGTVAVWVVVALVVPYVAVKWIQRQLFLRTLHGARISPDELKHALETGTPMVVDLRSAVDLSTTPFVIPGALRIAAEDLERRHGDIPRDREIVVYCS